MMERKGYAGPGPNTKGGGLRGGPKRWTGAGPAPARHIPWPEIFKHHISLAEGHLKMVDMVRKHTVEGTGNYRTIMGCVNRTKDMLQETKQISRSFVPPHRQREQVPLGSSSASMYPGYSPADHEYGKAAEEYGRAAAKARDEGIELKDPEIDYQIGQGRGVKRRSLAEIREAKAARENGSGSGSGSDRATGVSSARPPTTNGNSKEVKSEEADQEGDNPYFVIDTKPTPVNIPGIQNQPPKRSVSPPLEAIEGKKHKKAKRKHEGDLPDAKDGNGVQFEDISDKVDARLKEKEEKRKRKEEKKRKRESEGEPPAPAVTAQSNDDADASAEAHKPEKKKTKHGDEEALADRTASKKRSGKSAGVLEDGEGKKKKRKKPSTAD